MENPQKLLSWNMTLVFFRPDLLTFQFIIFKNEQGKKKKTKQKSSPTHTVVLTFPLFRFLFFPFFFFFLSVLKSCHSILLNSPSLLNSSFLWCNIVRPFWLWLLSFLYSPLHPLFWFSIIQIMSPIYFISSRVSLRFWVMCSGPHQSLPSHLGGQHLFCGGP